MIMKVLNWKIYIFLNQLSKKLNECFKQKSEKKKTNKILL